MSISVDMSIGGLFDGENSTSTPSSLGKKVEWAFIGVFGILLCSEYCLSFYFDHLKVHIGYEFYTHISPVMHPIAPTIVHGHSNVTRLC